MSRRVVLAWVALWVGCGTVEAPPARVALAGTWVFDPSRAERLFVVSAAEEGPERARALERALRDMKDLRIVFTTDRVTLATSLAARTVEYRVRHVQGPMVDIERNRDGSWVTTSIMVEGDEMTWFDADGEIEFVLKRHP